MVRFEWDIAAHPRPQAALLLWLAYSVQRLLRRISPARAAQFGTLSIFVEPMTREFGCRAQLCPAPSRWAVSSPPQPSRHSDACSTAPGAS